MSIDRTPAGNAVAHIPAPAFGAPSASICNAQSHWRQARLSEARGVLADIGHHPDSLVVLACRVICTHGSNSIEHADALGVSRLLGREPLSGVSVALNGGAT